MDQFILHKSEAPHLFRSHNTSHREISVTGLYVLAALCVVALAVGITLCCICDCSKEKPKEHEAKQDDERESIKRHNGEELADKQSGSK